MKHLIKKYILHVKIDDINDVLKNVPEHKQEVAEIMGNNLDGYYGIMITDKNELVQTFKYEESGKIFMIPEPNPIVIYFDSARHCFNQISGKRNEIFKNLTMFDNHISATSGDFYWYFSLASSYAIFLFTSLEAFINKMIPSDYEYRRTIQNKKTELFDRSQIQRYIEFFEKIKNIIPEITGKNFVLEHTHKYEQIKKLKIFRDEIVHTKNYNGVSVPNHYESLYATSLSFNYEQTLNFVKDFINYYQPDLIEICPCGGGD